MRYRVSDLYLKVVRGHVTSLVFILLASLSIVAWLFAMHPDTDGEDWGVFAAVALLIAAMFGFQGRKEMRQVAFLRQVRYWLAEDGIRVDPATATTPEPSVRYQHIEQIIVRADRFRPARTEVGLKVGRQILRFPQLDRQDEFVATVRERAPQAVYREKTTWPLAWS